MRLAVVCYPTYGGSGVVATELATALARRGHEVHVVSYEQPFRFDPSQPNLWFHQVEVSDYPLFRYRPYTLNLTNKLIALVEDHGVEVIHSHYAIPHAQAAWMAREVLQQQRGIDVKLACTLHGTDITLVGREHSFFELTRFTIQRQDVLTVPSRWLREETETFFHVGRDDVEVIPNFVDVERFRPAVDQEAAKRDLGAQGRAVITHASNFRPVKRVLDVVQAFAVLRERIDAVLALVGDGPDLPQALRLAQTLGVRDDVRALGRLERLERVLMASDVFLLPSVAESFGLAALEAQACGCPVIGYHAGGLPEVVRDGESGLLCPVGEDLCLGTLAADLLSDRPRYQAMRLAARRRAEEFAIGPIVDRYERVLCRLLGAGRTAGAAVAGSGRVPC
ncbi:MAG: N-acetyl-alpha-D-glucosaminyl L-malate synthase BshA [Acidobacteria bacterium]|nr:MAG: N-acetyl-alpha-D-glucosaminyl L-malate synthase BshA [Acidobacteriota bacterium]